MQYELYSIEKCGKDEVYYYHLSTDNIKTVFFYINQVDNDKKYILIDNYSNSPLDFRMSGLDKSLNKDEYEEMLLECKKVKYIEIFTELNYSIDEMTDLYLYSAKKETDFILNEQNNEELSY